MYQENNSLDELPAFTAFLLLSSSPASLASHNGHLAAFDKPA
jgi:hypothetical protein